MWVNVLDPNLASLASNAAVELDLLIHDEPTELGAVRQLGERLSKSLDKPSPDQPARALHVDTETETILGQAFLQAGNAEPATILGELIHRTEEIARQLATAEPGARNSMKFPLAFCLALSKSAAAYRQSMVEVRPPHPFRR